MRALMRGPIDTHGLSVSRTDNGSIRFTIYKLSGEEVLAFVDLTAPKADHIMALIKKLREEPLA